MTLRLFDRMATLVRADAHGMLEALEERSLLLKQHLREAELELIQKRARLDGLNSEDERLTTALERRQEEIAALDEDVVLALDGEKDELARFAIRRLLPKRRELEALTTARGQVREARTRLAAKLDEQEREFEELRERVQARSHEARHPADAPGIPSVSDEEIELELLRRRGSPSGANS
jgi:phage shock protein A